MDLIASARATGLYDPYPGTHIHHELSALQAGLDLLSDGIASLTQIYSAQAMPVERLHDYARLFGLAVPDGTGETQLRAAVSLLMRLPAPRAPDEIERLFEALGAKILLIEQPMRGRVLAEGSLGGFLPDAQTFLPVFASLLPAQTEAVLSLGELDWDRIAQSETDWAMLDQADFTWDWFDLYGHRLF